MKRSWLGFGFLLVLLILSLLVTWVMSEIHKPVVQSLELAADSAIREDWAEARFQAASAGTSWEKWDRLRRCFADHTPIEDVEALFAQLGVYGTVEESADFAAACRELARRVEAVGEAHGVSWWNVF